MVFLFEIWDISLSARILIFKYPVFTTFQAMDIDEILKRAETQDSHEGSTSMGEELLSQFKVR